MRTASPTTARSSETPTRTSAAPASTTRSATTRSRAPTTRATSAVGRCLNVPRQLAVPGRHLLRRAGAVRSGPRLRARSRSSPATTATPARSRRASRRPSPASIAERDVDQDGDPDAHCEPGHDCDDLNPDVSSLHAEVCANGIDDNCNGLVDEHPCVTPQGDTCANAVAVGGAGTYALSTLGANDTFATSCSVTNPSAAQNVVAAITVPPGAERRPRRVGFHDGHAGRRGHRRGRAAIRRRSSPAGRAPRRRTSAHALATFRPGPTSPSSRRSRPAARRARRSTSCSPPTSSPTDVDCASATPVQPGTPTTVLDRRTLRPTLPTACPATTGALTYSFTLTQTQDVHIYASTLQGSGSPIIGLRDPNCTGATDELECETAGAAPLYERSLPPGTYIVTVAATAPIDATLRRRALAAHRRPARPDVRCRRPPSSPNETLDLRPVRPRERHQGRLRDEWARRGLRSDADSASDVLLVDAFPRDRERRRVARRADVRRRRPRWGATSGNTPAATATSATLPRGTTASSSPTSWASRGRFEALVRADRGADDRPAGRRRHLRDSPSTRRAEDSSRATRPLRTPTTTNGCDAPGEPPGGAPDQVLALNLAQAQRVVLDMEGSGYTTLLSVMQGPSCPGTPVTERVLRRVRRGELPGPRAHRGAVLDHRGRLQRRQGRVGPRRARPAAVIEKRSRWRSRPFTASRSRHRTRTSSRWRRSSPTTQGDSRPRSSSSCRSGRPGSYLVREYSRQRRGTHRRRPRRRATKLRKNAWRDRDRRRAQPSSCATASTRTSSPCGRATWTRRTRSWSAPRSSSASKATSMRRARVEIDGAAGVARRRRRCASCGGAFEAPDYDTLVDSPIEIGTHREERFYGARQSRTDTPSGRRTACRDARVAKLVEDTKTLLELEARLFGGRAPLRQLRAAPAHLPALTRGPRAPRQRRPRSRHPRASPPATATSICSRSWRTRRSTRGT